jgi:DNA replication protein DnaC
MERTYDERTVSRLAAMMDIVPFNGEDYRKRA